MTWVQRHRLREYVVSSLWLPPVVTLVAAFAVAPVIRWIDASTRWPLLGFPLDGARNVVGTITASALAFIVFAFSMVLVAVQIASAQLSPRVVAAALRDRPLRITLGLFVFTFLYGTIVLARLVEPVAQLPVLVAIACMIASVCGLVFLIDHMARTLRPVGVLDAVTTAGLAAIERMHPERLDERAPTRGRLRFAELGAPTRVVPHAGRAGVVLALDTAGLIAAAERAACVIELVPHVGDYIGAGMPLFRVFQGGSELDDETLRGSVAIGPERTVEQDPAFAFRIAVDIAEKALSAAINDPTTAVIAIDHLQYLLHTVGQRRLDHAGLIDRAGKVRLFVHAPSWDDYVELAVTEIRLYGAQSMTVVRRLRFMLESLMTVLPAERHAALRTELDVLAPIVDRAFVEAADCARAAVADPQGLGGSEERLAEEAAR